MFQCVSASLGESRRLDDRTFEAPVAASTLASAGMARFRWSCISLIDVNGNTGLFGMLSGDPVYSSSDPALQSAGPPYPARCSSTLLPPGVRGPELCPSTSVRRNGWADGDKIWCMFRDQSAMHIRQVMGGVHLHVGTSAHVQMCLLFRTSETAGRIALKFGLWLLLRPKAQIIIIGVWLETHWQGVLQKLIVA